MTHYSNVLESVPIDVDDIAQTLLDIDYKTRSNPLKWTGQFSPQLVNVLISKYAGNSSQIFDPFLGSGTVLLEAGRMGRMACGSELNPAAVILARTYEFININHIKRKRITYAISHQLEEIFPVEWGIIEKAVNTETANHIIIILVNLIGNSVSHTTWGSLVHLSIVAFSNLVTLS